MTLNPVRLRDGIRQLLADDQSRSDGGETLMVAIANPGDLPGGTPLAASGFGPLTNGNGANVLASGNVGSNELLGLQVSSITGSTLVVELSNDNVTWTSLKGDNPTASTTQLTVTTANITTWRIAGFNYWRVRQSVYGSGTTAGAAALSMGNGIRDVVVTNLTLLAGTTLVGSTAAGASSTVGTAMSTSLLLQSPAGTDAATLVKGSAAKLFKLALNNTSATKGYLKLYNKATQGLSSDTPLVTIPLFASASFERNWADIGLSFPLGLSYRLTTGIANNDVAFFPTLGNVECIQLDFI